MASQASLNPLAAGLAFGLSLATVLAVASPAVALKLGSLAPPDSGGCGSCNAVQKKSAPGEPSYEVPPGKWEITSWSAQGGGSAPGKARLRVYRPTDTKGQLKLVRQSKIEKVPADGHPAFQTSLYVKGGDLIGIYTVDNLPSAFASGIKKDVTWVSGGCPSELGERVGVGTACELNPLKSELVNAEVTLSKR